MEHSETSTDNSPKSRALRRAVILRLAGYRLQSTDLAQLTDEELARLLVVTK